MVNFTSIADIYEDQIKIFMIFQITCHDNKDGTVSVSFLPTAPGEYKVSVRFGDKHIKGSPYVAKVGQHILEYFLIFHNTATLVSYYF